MNQQRIEGTILRSLLFRDYDRILTVFSLEAGLIKFVIKGINKKFLAATPFTVAEFIYLPGKNDLHKCQEMTPFHSHLPLRNSLACLEVACEMSKTILQTQPAETPTPLLYSLFQWTLHKIPLVKDPYVLLLSFYLKLLKHEGLLHLITSENQCCSQCNTPLQESHLMGGEFFCSSHAPATAIAFAEEEMKWLSILASLSSFQEIKEMVIAKESREKIHMFCKVSAS